MIRQIKEGKNYAGVIAVLSLLTLVAGVLYFPIGEILLPVLVPFYAALLIFENPKKRFFSIAIPLAVCTLSVFIGGGPGLLTLVPFISGIVLAICYRFFRSKAETSVYLSSVIFIGLFLSVYLSAAVKIGAYDIESVIEYYSDICIRLRSLLVSTFSSMKSIPGADYDPETYAEIVGNAFDAFVDCFVGLLATISFAFAGISIKIFSFISFRTCKHGMLRSFSHFLPTSVISYTYVIISIITAFSIGESAFALALVNINQLLLAVFFYTGLRALGAIMAALPRRGFLTMATIAAFVFMPTVAIQIISYLGAWFAITNSPSRTTEE